MIPMALAGGGTMRTMHPSNHMRTNAGVIEAFLPVRFAMEETGEGPWAVSVEGC
jgi:RNA 3'-terminal phosphate cyclase (ATP)